MRLFIFKQNFFQDSSCVLGLFVLVRSAIFRGTLVTVLAGVISRVIVSREAYTFQDSPFVLNVHKKTGGGMSTGIEALITKAKASDNGPL